MQPDSNKTTLVALSLFLALAWSGIHLIDVEAKPAANPPKTAPDRRLRLQRPETAPPAEQKSVGSQNDSAVKTDGDDRNNWNSSVNTTTPANGGPSTTAGSTLPAATTTVSLQGGVTRLDGNADTFGTQPRSPLTGKIESLIDTPLQAQKPRSETVPPQLFRAWLESAHPQYSLSASSNPDDSVVVLKGQWDNSAKTLEKFQIPHVKIGGGKLESMPLDRTRVIIVDCAGKLPRSAFQKLKDFVLRGGYLLSTDWALDNFTGPIFTDQRGREFIQWNKAVNRRDMVDATVFDTDPVLFNRAVTNAYWKLDTDSHLIRVINREAVRVLATSAQLRADDPDRAGILAVVFPYGRGYVMHMTGHFDNNAKIAVGNFLPDPAPNIKISLRQAMAANFVVAGLTGTRIQTTHSR